MAACGVLDVTSISCDEEEGGLSVGKHTNHNYSLNISLHLWDVSYLVSNSAYICT